MSEIYYRVQEPDVTFEIFEDEIIVINLANGRYHNIRGSGTWLWQALAAGVGRSKATDLLLAAEAPDPDPDAARKISEFIDQLTAEDLLIATPLEGENASELPEAPGVYITPLIETFTDMEHLLAIDPIHEVDAQGWPSELGAL